MKHNTELTFVGVVGALRDAAAFTIGGFKFHSAVVTVDDGDAVVEVFEGCGDEVHRFAGDKMPALIRDWIARADAGETAARDLLHEVATEGLREIRELRAEPLMLKPATATMRRREGYWNGRVGAFIPARWTAEVDIDEAGKAVYSDGMPTREACIADLHRQAGSHGYIVTRIEERA